MTSQNSFKWVYSSKADYEDTPYHHFLMDWDNEKKIPKINDDEYLLPSKTYGHFHIIRPYAHLSLNKYLEELKKRKCPKHYLLGVNMKEEGFLYVYHHEKLPDLWFMERYVQHKNWSEVCDSI